MGSFKFVDEAFQPLMDTERWTTFPSIRDESVAEHTAEVMMISYVLALETEQANIGEVLERALLHDIEESCTGDIPRWAKRRSDDFHQELDNIEHEFINEITSDVVQSDRIQVKWEESKDNSIEGKIVKCADIISAVYGMYREQELGNDKLLERSAGERGIEDAIEICSEVPAADKFLAELLNNVQ